MDELGHFVLQQAEVFLFLWKAVKETPPPDTISTH